MLFKPVDEMSLRHLFSSDAAKRLLKMSYLGPVLNSSGSIENNPDAMILDMRKSPYRPRRCEFKFQPTGENDFSHNGNFDIAVIWSVLPPATYESLSTELFNKHGCREIVVMSNYDFFSKLPDYEWEVWNRNFDISTVDRTLLNANPAGIFALYIAATIAPKRIDLTKMNSLLCVKFRSVSEMSPQGRSNVTTAFVQTNPPLLLRTFGKSYQWNADFDGEISASYLSDFIVNRLGIALPTQADIEQVIDHNFY